MTLEVSIIILLYNSEDYLDECMQSAINQTYRDLEIIVVLNGQSKDNTEVIVERYSSLDKRIKIVRNEKDSVISHGLKIGMDNVTGKYFTILEGDDYLAPDAIENLLEVAERREADLVTGNFLKVTTNGEKIELAGRPSFKELSPVEFFRVAFPYMDFFYHGKLFAKKTYQKDFKLLPAFIANDVLVTYQLALNANKIVNCDKIVHFFRQSKKSVSQNLSIGQLEDGFECYLLLNKKFEEQGIYKQNEELQVLFETQILRMLASCLIAGKGKFYRKYKVQINPVLHGKALNNEKMRLYLKNWTGVLLTLDIYKFNSITGNICISFFDVIRKIRKSNKLLKQICCAY